MKKAKENKNVKLKEYICMDDIEEKGIRTFNDVVKTTVFLSDMADFAAMNEVYKQYYDTECPARSAFAVKALPMGALVEIETIAGK